MSEQTNRRLRVGLIATAYYQNSHADVMASRWMKPRNYDADWGWPRPRTDLVSAHIVQRYEDDIGIGHCKEAGVPHFDTIHEALTVGTDKLAVGAVLFVGEHGKYPYNELGQKLYPRKEIFDQIVDVFQSVGQCVPVFNDKYFSWNAQWSQQMYDTAKQMGFMLLGGSSVPHTRRQPQMQIPTGSTIDEAVGIYYQLDEIYGYHGFENLQSMVERRASGETGIASVTVWRDEQVWEQLDNGAWSLELMEAAIASYPEANRKPGDYRENFVPNDRADCPPEALGPITAFQFQYHDGLRATLINLTGHVEGFAAACRVNGNTVAASADMAGAEHHYAHFATLNAVIEESLLAGKPIFPQERVLLVSKAISEMMQARATPGVTRPTPELNIQYSTDGYAVADTPDGGFQDCLPL